MKKFDFNLGKYIYDLIKKPFRTKIEFILLILETIKIINNPNITSNSAMGKIILKIDKMNRLFYEVENKIFSIQFPFFIEKEKDQNNFRIYDNELGKVIDNKTTSVLIGIFFGKDDKATFDKISFENFFETLYSPSKEDKNIETEDLWKLIKKLILFDIGYLRYDYDEKHANGKLHPLNHLDINYESNATYKIGLDDKIKIEDLIDIVDSTSECSFLNILSKWKKKIVRVYATLCKLKDNRMILFL